MYLDGQSVSLAILYLRETPEKPRFIWRQKIGFVIKNCGSPAQVHSQHLTNDFIPVSNGFFVYLPECIEALPKVGKVIS